MRAAFALLPLAIALLSSPLLAQDIKKTAPPKAEADQIIQAKFDEIDRNRNGSINLLELTSYGVGQKMGTSVRQRCWKRLDMNGNGAISIQEFKIFLAKQNGLSRKAKTRC